jgi:hypothetical protein
MPRADPHLRVQGCKSICDFCKGLSIDPSDNASQNELRSLGG